MNPHPAARAAAATRWHAVALLAIVLASLALRNYVSRHSSLWLDEIWTRHDSALSWPELLRGPSREHPPLMFVLVRLSTAVFGTSEAVLRAPSFFFGCVLLVAVYYLCLELRFRPTSALVVVASFAIAPFFVRHATEARNYAMFAAFTTLATLFTLRLLRVPDDFRSLVGFALSAALAAATHYFGVAYSGALVGVLALEGLLAWRRRASPLRIQRRSLFVVAGLMLVLGAVTARAIWLAHFYSTHTVGPPARHLFASILGEFSFLSAPPLAPKVEPFVAAAGLLAVGFRLRGMARVIPFALAFVPCALALLVSSGHAMAPRYLAPSFVFYQLGAATAVLEVCERIAGGGSFGVVRLLRGVPALLLLALPFAARVAQYPQGYSLGGYYFAGLQAYFRDARNQQTGLVVFPHFPGEFLLRQGYPVDVPLQSLESFEPLPGVKRYLVAEFERPSQGLQFEDELSKRLHVSRRKWRATPVLALPKTKFQPAVRARVVAFEP
jgi:4-amino-4-deoxy-L-arabinose transferase-like glycosyltransferase